MSMERATPLEQVQIVPLMLHAQGQVGCLVECGHRKATKRGLLLTPSTLFSKEEQLFIYLRRNYQPCEQPSL